ncbi:uncharacterized protein M421DRAFT_417262 [Didymella exigua CBS 183.55]|uniref:BTB domain-containing protein n=1 Tax=Didymella exigua CBS 183.55 TaxID=1150837 RepID=A0A6A5RVE9_9PLEO|nr:uncharacterized protein M421DRAFT_417262 [Didymella exigua CBS 183.55]KAF1931493.1 hypothetical protein M421DRAFT_417262 [Didymella exigua CBS 183.55]
MFETSSSTSLAFLTRLGEKSSYFRAVCTGGFAESDKHKIRLPESEKTIAAMLDEIYGTYNSTTGSLSTGFVLRPETEKERARNDLLDLFIASEKYGLEKDKTKVVKAIIDRLPFVQDSLIIVDLATYVYDDQTPQVDCGLRKAIIQQIYIRLPPILSDKKAWQEYSENRAVSKALHAHVAHLFMPGVWSELDILSDGYRRTRPIFSGSSSWVSF